jgi:hypothetical protein
MRAVFAPKPPLGLAAIPAGVRAPAALTGLRRYAGWKGACVAIRRAFRADVFWRKDESQGGSRPKAKPSSPTTAGGASRGAPIRASFRVDSSRHAGSSPAGAPGGHHIGVSGAAPGSSLPASDLAPRTAGSPSQAETNPAPLHHRPAQPGRSPALRSIQLTAASDLWQGRPQWRGRTPGRRAAGSPQATAGATGIAVEEAPPPAPRKACPATGRRTPPSG